MCIPLGSPSVDASVLGGVINGKSMVINSVQLLSAAGIAASNTDYAIVQLKKGASIVAALDTRAAGQGALVASTPKSLVVDAALKTVASGDVISVNYDETDAATNVALSGAVLCFNYTVK